MIERGMTVAFRLSFAYLRARCRHLFALAGIGALALAAAPVFAFSPSSAAALYPEPPEITARSALMIDLESGAVLYERNADEVIAPASLTKVAAMYAVHEAVERGQVSFDDKVTIPPEAWASSMPPHSSLMFLGPEQTVTLDELMYGLAIASGNDAAIATAAHLAGGVPLFVAKMNDAMRRLGLKRTRFVEPAGLSAENSTTAREFTRFLYAYLTRWPEALTRFHSPQEFAYPLDHNRAAGNGEPTITQANRNLLLRTYEGADGIKTGYIPASRYNLAFTAEREGRRLLGVLLGVPADNHLEGGAERALQAAALLDYGFDRFINVQVARPSLDPVPVWFGSARTVPVRVDERSTITLPPELVPRLEGELRIPGSHEAPVAAGAELGELRYTVGGRLVHSRGVYAAESVERGSLWRVLWDRVRRFFLSLGERFA